MLTGRPRVEILVTGQSGTVHISQTSPGHEGLFIYYIVTMGDHYIGSDRRC